MPKYWVKNYFRHAWEIPRSGSKAEDGERKKERAKVGENNGQGTHGAQKHAWHTQAAWANNGQLRFVRHHVWFTQARLDQKS